MIDEMSMVGRKTLGQVDRRLRQIFPHCTQEVFGGCPACCLVTLASFLQSWTFPSTELSDQGRNAYQQFDKAFVLDQVMRQAGQDPHQVRFRDILLRLRDAKVTVADWNHLMTQTPTHVQERSPFVTSLHLHPTVEAIVEYNVTQLRASGKPIATIKAVHTGPNASKAPADDAGGLEAVICLAHGACVMFTSNLGGRRFGQWTHGTIAAICYRSGGPPDLPVAVMVHFDKYCGPTLHDGTVPITPIHHTWSAAGASCSRLQLHLKLAWAVTIHKSQGLTLDKVIIDVGKEFAAGLTFVACSRVRHLQNLLFIPPFSYQWLGNLANSQRLLQRMQDQRLLSLLPLPPQHTSPPLMDHSMPSLPPPPSLPSHHALSTSSTSHHALSTSSHSLPFHGSFHTISDPIHGSTHPISDSIRG